MFYKILWLLVEGKRDTLFFDNIIIPLFKDRYDVIQKYEYSQKTDEEVNKLIRNIKRMKHDFILFADIDNSPCITNKKSKIEKHYNGVNDENIIIVIKEIESWYLAGLDYSKAKKLQLLQKINPFGKTDDVNKEEFLQLIPKKGSEIDFRVEVLKHFSMEIAASRNDSLNYFFKKYGFNVDANNYKEEEVVI